MFPDAATPQAWAIVSGFILDFSSDEVVKIISRSGLDVDWSLTPEQDYSHKTRKRAYAPKIQAAYQRLSDQQKRLVVNALIPTSYFCTTMATKWRVDIGTWAFRRRCASGFIHILRLEMKKF